MKKQPPFGDLIKTVFVMMELIQMLIVMKKDLFSAASKVNSLKFDFAEKFPINLLIC